MTVVRFANGMPVASMRRIMDVPSMMGATGALVAGASGSLHCALMCGPLACASAATDRPGTGARARLLSITAYQGARIASYTAVGAALGLAGRGLALTLSSSVAPYLPWLMAAGLVITALDLGKRLRPLPGVAQVARVLARVGAKFSQTGRAATLGAATPFLPCGLLYGVMLAAIATGSVLGGAAVMGAFSLGAVPALAVTQVQGRWLAGRPRLSLIVTRGVPLTAAVVLVWRAVTAEPQQSCH